METKEAQALRRAVEKAGGQSALARACGVKQGHVWHWINKSLRVPAEHVLSVEAATGGTVTRHELRPDIFGNERNLQIQPTNREATDRTAAGTEAPIRADIAEQIALLEAKQHRAVREALLNKKGAAGRLVKLDRAIAALRALA
ncbi:MAG: helix-turn-helix domain-containing protein [Betaproteobacteria bacterium]|nr:helix-turn-helix domain-containing protein [Betaproteobacteria bacterium]